MVVLLSFLWIEKQQHSITTSEKDVPGMFPGENLQPQDIGVKRLCGAKVSDVQAGFEDALNLHH